MGNTYISKTNVLYVPILGFNQLQRIMKAKYDFRVMPDLQGKEEEQRLYPQLVTSGTITLKDLMQRASKHTGFSPAASSLTSWRTTGFG